MATIIGCFAGFLCLALVAFAMPRGPFVLVMTSPADGEAGLMSVIAHSGGEFVSGTSQPFLAVAYSQDKTFASRLLSQGALLVLNHTLALGCKERTNP